MFLVAFVWGYFFVWPFFSPQGMWGFLLLFVVVCLFLGCFFSSLLSVLRRKFCAWMLKKTKPHKKKPSISEPGEGRRVWDGFVVLPNSDFAFSKVEFITSENIRI